MRRDDPVPVRGESLALKLGYSQFKKESVLKNATRECYVRNILLTGYIDDYSGKKSVKEHRHARDLGPLQGVIGDSLDQGSPVPSQDPVLLLPPDRKEMRFSSGSEFEKCLARLQPEAP